MIDHRTKDFCSIIIFYFHRKHSYLDFETKFAQISLRVAPARQRRKGLRNSVEKLSPKICFRSEFLERNLCEALC